jgi:hypothetical protein
VQFLQRRFVHYSVLTEIAIYFIRHFCFSIERRQVWEAFMGAE